MQHTSSGFNALGYICHRKVMGMPHAGQAYCGANGTPIRVSSYIGAGKYIRLSQDILVTMADLITGDLVATSRLDDV